MYDELICCPPAGVEFLVHGFDTKKYPLLNQTYQIVRGVAGHIVRPLLRKTVLATAPKADLIHFCDHISFSKTPFVADFEHAWSFLPYINAGVEKFTTKLFDDNRANVQKLVKQKTCKRLIFWLEKGKQSAIRAYNLDDIENKMVTIPLAMRIPEHHKPLDHEGFNLLFIGTRNLKGDELFYARGGVRLLRVFRKFCEGKNDVKLILASEMPESEKPRLRNLPVVNAGIMSKEKFEYAFRTSDALFFPSYATPGLGFLEAMRYHLPIVTTDSWANTEIVANDKNGLVCEVKKSNKEGPYGIPPNPDDYVYFEKNDVDQELEDSLLEAIEKLYLDRKLARKLGEHGFKEISEGKFSIKRRNQELLKVYSKAIE